MVTLMRRCPVIIWATSLETHLPSSATSMEKGQKYCPWTDRWRYCNIHLWPAGHSHIVLILYLAMTDTWRHQGLPAWLAGTLQTITNFHRIVLHPCIGTILQKLKQKLSEPSAIYTLLCFAKQHFWQIFWNIWKFGRAGLPPPLFSKAV